MFHPTCSDCGGWGYVYQGGMSLSPEIDNKFFCPACLSRFKAIREIDIKAHDMSPQRVKFRQLLVSLQDDEHDRCVYAHINDFLTGVSAADFSEAVADAPYQALSHHTQNYLAAMVEQAAQLKNQPVPAWTGQITPLAEPYFAVPLKSLRLHLLTQSPPAFRRRNIFVDAGIGDRV